MTAKWYEWAREIEEACASNRCNCGSAIAAALAAAQQEAFRDFVPDSQQISRLPEPLRRWIMELETKCDPADDLRRAVLAEDGLAQARAGDFAAGAEAAAELVKDHRLCHQYPSGTLIGECYVALEKEIRALAAKEKL